MASARGLSSLSETERRGGGGREASGEHRPINPSVDLLPLPEKFSRSRRSDDTVEPDPLNLAGKADNHPHNPLVPGGARARFLPPAPTPAALDLSSADAPPPSRRDFSSADAPHPGRWAPGRDLVGKNAVR